MADKYSTIQQHQPLRVPQGWDKQEKALVVQLDEIFDDIYRRFGRLRMEDMGKAFRKQIKDDEGNIAQLVVDVRDITIEVRDKYDIVSGITINTNGIALSGSKYIDIASGCYIDIKSGGTIEIESGGDLNIKSGGAIDVKSGGSIDIESGGGINIKSGGAIDVKSGGSIDIESSGGMNVKSGGNLEVKSGGTFKIVSGGNIDMKASGTLELTGSTVSIKSGSTFDVDSTNFKISSADEMMVCGNWKFTNKGVEYKATGWAFEEFVIAHEDDVSAIANMNATGIAYDVLSSSANLIELFYKPFNLRDPDGNRRCSLEFHVSALPYAAGVCTFSGVFRPNIDNTVSLGEPSQRFSGGYFNSITASSITATLVTGTLGGGRIPSLETSAKNANNLTDPNLYAIDASNLTNGPSGASGWIELEVTNWGPINNLKVMQKAWTASAIYTRLYDGSSWGSWYKFTGTAV